MTTRLYVSGGNLRARKEAHRDNICAFHLSEKMF